ncbi:helix-turn-helix domain-containing protein [Metabacillus sp. Hm71]|uniref:helix-turn-helix domain-containing protein n=1 Tax=Metabacillus sp. Hm71 TaxID=3450743 RepID=UPI003F435088
MHIGERLKAIRLAKGLTQADVSEMINVDKGLISRAERSSNVGSLLLRKLCIVYNVSSSYILELEDNQFDLETKWTRLINLAKGNNLSYNDVFVIVKNFIRTNEEIKPK